MNPELVATRYGLLQTPGANDLISRFLREFGEWAWLEADFVGGFVQPGQRVLDGGAYIGTFTLGLADRRPAQVVAVEANMAVLELLQHNLRTLAASWTTLEHGLLGDGCSPVPAPRATHPDNLGATSFAGGPALPGGGTGEPSVPALSLRSLRERHGPFDLIKLDVEGFELTALQGDADWLAQHRPTLWLECNEDPAVLPLFDFVTALGYELHYFAFPSFNPENHNGNPQPIFAVSYEAGLLAVRPGTEVTTPPLQARTGCDLVRVQDREHLRKCLWLTPRWGEAEWAKLPRSRLLALCARLHRHQELLGFLSGSLLKPTMRTTINVSSTACAKDFEPESLDVSASSFPASLGVCVFPVPFAEENQVTVLSQHVWSRIDQIPGWLSLAAADFTYRLLQSEAFQTTEGSLVEIGVFKGKYLSLIAHATQGQSRKVIGIDGFFAGYQQPLETKWVEGARTEMINNIVSCASEVSVEIVQANSEDLSPSAFRRIVSDKCAFLSIDAGHDAHEVYNDLRISCSTLSPGAIVAADDVFNSVVPGVAEGVFRFLTSSEGRMLAPFATCGNKLFMCITEQHEKYVELSHRFLLSAGREYLDKSKAHVDNNTRIGFIPRMFGYEVVPFLE